MVAVALDRTFCCPAVGIFQPASKTAHMATPRNRDGNLRIIWDLPPTCTPINELVTGYTIVWTPSTSCCLGFVNHAHAALAEQTHDLMRFELRADRTRP